MAPHTVAMIAAAVFLLLAMIGVFGTITSLAKSRRSRSWPTAPGKITHSEVTVDVSYERDSDDNATDRLREKKMYGVKLAYSYVVNGIAHVGSRLYWSDGIKTSGDGGARKIVAAYPVGRDVAVYYQPDDPATALLEPGAIRGAVMTGFFAAAFGAFGIVFLVVALRGA